jgi:hypothetical protein
MDSPASLHSCAAGFPLQRAVCWPARLIADAAQPSWQAAGTGGKKGPKEPVTPLRPWREEENGLPFLREALNV